LRLPFLFACRSFSHDKNAAARVCENRSASAWRNRPHLPPG
jgi:hypothetical protein